MTEPIPADLDAEYAKKMASCQNGDNENDHNAADLLLVELLARLGAVQTVAEYEKVGKWYA